LLQVITAQPVAHGQYIAGDKIVHSDTEINYCLLTLPLANARQNAEAIPPDPWQTMKENGTWDVKFSQGSSTKRYFIFLKSQYHK
jgi:hypothetical protein